MLIALVGTVLPHAASHRAIVHLPAGVMSILMSMVAMFAFPMALGMGMDRFSWRRLTGLLLGLDAMQMLFGDSLVGVIITAPVALGSGQWIDPFAAP